MALSDIPYLTASWTVPSSDLTDYVGYFDLSNAPQSWWDEVDTSDGTKMRVSKDDAAEGSTSATELAFEVVDFDDTAQEGHLWFLWSGTLSSTSPDDVRIYPAKSSASSYGVTDTFGRNAVWADEAGVYHMDTLVDSTGNNANATTGGGVTVGGATGKIGSATEFDGSNDYWDLGHGSGTDIADSDFTMQGWGFLQTKGGDRDLVSKSMGDTVSPELRYDLGDDLWEFNINDGSFRYAKYSQSNASTGAWKHLTAVREGSTIRIYVDGVEGSTTTTVGSISNGSLDFAIGALDPPSGRFWDGIIDEVRMRYSAKGADFIALEYSNQNDASTFWSSITLDNTGGGTNFDGDVSIGHTLGLSPSASAAVTGGVTNAQTMGMSDQGGATTLASLEQAITLALATSGAISLEGNITVNVSYGQDVSATAQTSAELSGAENVTLFHSYAMSTSAQSGAAGATTIDLSYDQSVTGAVGINNFDASVALGALTYQTSITGTASTVADTTQSIQYALDSIAAAAASSGVTIDHINDISAIGNVITVDVTLSDGRTLSITQQNRTLSIDTENRTLTIKP